MLVPKGDMPSGNQGNRVQISRYPAARVVAYRLPA
jgi:hypothetical protein